MKDWKNVDAVVTSFDEFKNELETVINSQKFITRAEIKPMAKIRDDNEAHIISRARHMQQSANIGQKLAKGLGLNETIIYIGMLMHDAGHTFGGHEGEQTLNLISRLRNIGFFHHNAKGVDVLLSEDIINKFVNAVPGAKKDEKLRKKLEDEAWIFLDVVNGHDGEASQKDLIEQNNNRINYPTVKEAVLSKVSRANQRNEYKCQVETLEAQIAKQADVLSYLKSDFLDGFEQGIIKRFSDNYLEQIGILFSNDENLLSREENIKKAKEYIEQIKRDRLRETREDIYNEEGKETLECVNRIIEELKKQGVDTYYPKEEDEKIIISTTRSIVEEFRRKRNESFEEHHSVESEIHKIIDCTQKMLKVRRSVIEEVLTDVQDKFIQDYLETISKEWEKIDNDKELSPEERLEKKRNSMSFSAKVSKVFFDIKKLDYDEYVQYTKKVYQTESIPAAVDKTVTECAEALVKMGIIRDKFYSKSVLKSIKNEEIKKSMQIPPKSEREYTRYKEKIGIHELKREKGIKRAKVYKQVRHFTSKLPLKSLRRKKLYKGIYGYTQRQEERFARTCEDVYEAIPTTVRMLVKSACSPVYELNQYLPKVEKKKISEVKEEMNRYFYENKLEVTSQNIESFISNKIEEERNDLEKKVATSIAIQYLGGFNDRGIAELLKSIGNLSRVKFKLQDKRSKEKNTTVLALSKKLEEDNATGNGRILKESFER